MVIEKYKNFNTLNPEKQLCFIIAPKMNHASCNWSSTLRIITVVINQETNDTAVKNLELLRNNFTSYTYHSGHYVEIPEYDE